MNRLPPQPGERISRETRIRFTFDGKQVQAYEGDTIGSALYAAGQRTFSRSFKYHRRRGLLCCAGQCPNCIVSVDGDPGVRACVEPARDGMRVEHVNAWPGLGFDAMRVVDLVGRRLTPPGFYYKTLVRPRRLWPLYEKLLRRAAGLGRLPPPQRERQWRTEYRRRHADVLVVGGGVAGVRAASAAAELGADVVLVDEQWPPHVQGVEVLARASALGYFDGLVPVWQEDTLHQVRARRHVFATGTIEQPLMFEGNDLPGVMLSGGVRRLIEHYAVRPGARAVVVAAREIVATLERTGIDVVAMADGRVTVIEARGRKHLEQVVLEDRTIDCDLLVVSGGSIPADSLARQAGAATDVHTAGAVVGFEGAQAEPSGELAGLEAAHAIGLGTPESRERAVELETQLHGTRTPTPDPMPPAPAKAFICLCEDVTSKDIALSVAEGYDSSELCKRYTTVTMGPCQGRMCQLAATRAIAHRTGQSAEAVGGTTARPPWTPVPMGVLAGRPFEPAKRSAIHDRHRERGANVMWAGDWRRAYDYGDPYAEALNVHETAGLIDVSTLGKLLVRGPDAGRFLDRLYPNRLSNLKPGRVRYGVISSDAGRVVDDGTVCRLDEETFYVTTTSSGADAIEEWFSWWLTDWDMDVQLTDVTQGTAAVNLAGPRAREIMAKVTGLDCSADSFVYLDGKQADVAGVPSLILRIGFVGELGYEIHFPAAYGAHVWDALLEAGHEDGIRPFGLEPQRLLRLQKLHLLVGQDTDSESTPFGAAMPWIVKLDKDEDFVGRWALEHHAENGPAIRLVGFTVPDGEVPTEGAVVLGGGQVTSARYSPILKRVIGIAWVPDALASDGAQITIADNGRTLNAEVQTRPFYDPEGEVLRS